MSQPYEHVLALEAALEAAAHAKRPAFDVYTATSADMAAVIREIVPDAVQVYGRGYTWIRSYLMPLSSVAEDEEDEEDEADEDMLSPKLSAFTFSSVIRAARSLVDHGFVPRIPLTLTLLIACHGCLADGTRLRVRTIVQEGSPLLLCNGDVAVALFTTLDISQQAVVTGMETLGMLIAQKCNIVDMWPRDEAVCAFLDISSWPGDTRAQKMFHMMPEWIRRRYTGTGLRVPSGPSINLKHRVFSVYFDLLHSDTFDSDAANVRWLSQYTSVDAVCTRLPPFPVDDALKRVFLSELRTLQPIACLFPSLVRALRDHVTFSPAVLSWAAFALVDVDAVIALLRAGDFTASSPLTRPFAFGAWTRVWGVAEVRRVRAATPLTCEFMTLLIRQHALGRRMPEFQALADDMQAIADIGPPADASDARLVRVTSMSTAHSRAIIAPEHERWLRRFAPVHFLLRHAEFLYASETSVTVTRAFVRDCARTDSDVYRQFQYHVPDDEYTRVEQVIVAALLGVRVPPHVARTYASRVRAHVATHPAHVRALLAVEDTAVNEALVSVLEEYTDTEEEEERRRACVQSLMSPPPSQPMRKRARDDAREMNVD